VSDELDLFVDSPSGSNFRLPTSPTRGWAGWILVAAAIITAAIIFRGCDSSVGPIDDEQDTVIDLPVKGVVAMVVYNTEQDDDWTQDQRAILTSPDVLSWYQENCTQVDGMEAYRAFTTKQIEGGLKNENKVWSELSKAITLDPPCVIVGNGKKARQFTLPDNPESHIKTLDRALKQVKR
jgi:hypothetical protein